jgi:4-diphosphocytidyl-2-C-methyl-D-erythritol kinase
VSLRGRAPAKVNLTLAVGARDADGLHAIRSIFLRIGLADQLSVDFAAAASGSDELSVEGDYDCPVEGNLVLSALSLLREAAGQPLPPLATKLVKHVPLGAGLAGGSSDGATALALAARAWRLGLAPLERVRIAAALGSDVPFFAADVPAALVEGRGEDVRALPAIAGEAGVLLSVAPRPLLTARVFARHDELDPAPAGSNAATDRLTEAFAAGLDAQRLAGAIAYLRDANDLWPAASSLDPDAAPRRDALERETGRPWLMSGSGATLFSLYASPGEAEEAGRHVMAVAPAELAGGTLIASDLTGDRLAWRSA